MARTQSQNSLIRRNCGTSLIAGVAVFSILGNLAYNMQASVPEVVKSESSRVCVYGYGTRLR